MQRFTTAELVSYLRTAVAVANEEAAGEDGLVEDLAYAAMSDEQLEMFIRVVATRDYSQYPLSKIPNEAVYPITMLARRELYWKLATHAAPLYNLQADGASLSRTQRFEHYFQLIQQLDREFEDWEENGGGNSGGDENGAATSFNVQLPERYNTTYNQNTALPPAVILYVDNVGSDYVELSWEPKRHTSYFQDYRVFVSDKGNVFDLYQVSDISKITAGTQHLLTIKNIWQKSCRIRGLKAETQYSVGILVTANGGKKAYDMDTIITIASEQEIDFNSDTLVSGE